MTITRSAPAVAARPRRAAVDRFRHDIEGLRALAVLLVVLYHCGVPGVGGGFVGVDVFFVISGFLITGLLLRELTTRGTISIAGFYGRRALRLLPAASVVIVTTVVASAWLLPSVRRLSVLYDGLQTMAYSINFRLAAVGTDYLNADIAPSPLQHFWSLAVEEQFYLVWPPLLLALALYAGRKRRRPARAVLLMLTAVVVVSFALSLWQTSANPTWAYFGPHTRAWELGVGALLAFVPLARLRRTVARTLVALGLVAVLTAAFQFTAVTAFPGYAALLPVLGAAAILAGGAAAPSPLLASRPMRRIGRLSYSWYLWHWPALTIAPMAAGHDLALWERLLVAAGALGAALLTYHFVENPARGLSWLRETPWRAIVAGAATTAVAAGICLIAVPVLGRTVDARRPTYQARQLIPGPFDLRELPALVAESVTAPDVPRNLVPALETATADVPRIYHEGCSAGVLDTKVRASCVYGDKTSPTTVVLYGDSHAGHWFPALDAVARQRRWQLAVVTKGACTGADQLTYLAQLKRDFTECATWRRAAWHRIQTLRPTAIVMASLVTDRLPAEQAQLPPAAGDRLWVAAWMRTVDTLGATGAKLFYVNDTPTYGHFIPDCLAKHLESPRYCAETSAQVVRMPDRRRAILDAMQDRGVTVIDPLPWLCTATDCPVIVGNVLVYRDAHHLTTEYSRLLAPLLSRQLTLDGA